MAIPSNIDNILNELKEQAERRASFRMFYSAADLLREYKGPYAQETAAERERMAVQYHQMGKDAEEARWGEGTGTTPRPVTPRPPPPRPATARPAAPPPATPPKPKPASTRPPKPASAKPKTPQPASYTIDGDKMNFTCRWCKEPVTAPVAEAGKYMPCPKCDNLLAVPKMK